MMSDAPTKGGKLRNVITQNVVLANQKTESFVYQWLRALTMFNVTCFPAFVGVSDVISSVLSKVELYVLMSSALESITEPWQEGLV